MSELLENNSLAIAELSGGNDLAAQTLFRDNAKNHPCCLSLNNLGVYYTQYGMIRKDGRIQSAKKTGLKYLLKASRYETDWRNCVSAAMALLEAGNPEDACQFLFKACTINADDRIRYNLGVCLFRLEKYQEAAAVFESLCTGSAVDRILQDGGQHPFLILAYCQIKLCNTRGCMGYIRRYREAYSTEERLDVFHLRYLCGMYEEALWECSELLEEWYPTKAILAMVIECLSGFPSRAAATEEAIPRWLKPQWNALKKDASLRRKEIGAYAYLPPPICWYPYMI